MQLFLPQVFRCADLRIERMAAKTGQTSATVGLHVVKKHGGARSASEKEGLRRKPGDMLRCAPIERSGRMAAKTRQNSATDWGATRRESTARCCAFDMRNGSIAAETKQSPRLWGYSMDAMKAARRIAGR